MWFPDDARHLQALGELLDRWVLRWVRHSLAPARGAGATLRPNAC